ncbi:MAG: TonB-dependent receptor [Flavobacteriaceae bacterium]
MKKLMLFCMLTLTMNSFAQLAKSKLPKPGVISGKVIDLATKEPLPYVNVVIRDMAKKVITGGITGDNGTFKIKDIPEGKSIVEIQFIGFKTFTKEITVTSKNRNISLGTVPLEEDAAQLDEVVVRAETSTVIQKVDRKVINVGKDLTSAGTTASELLNNVQSVSVDSQTGQLSLRGNQNVRVLVDGRPTNIPTAQLLRQIPSNSIKSIELITNPSAKYNPEGMSGIINIILNKNSNIGFNASVDGGVTAGHYVRYNTSANMNYKTGDVNFFLNYGHNSGDQYNFGFVERPGVNLQEFVFTNSNQSDLLKIGADIYLNEKNTLSLYTTQNWSSNSANGSAIITANGVQVNNSPNFQASDSKNAAYNLNYKTDFEKKGHNLEFELTYSKNKAPQDLINTDLVDPTNGELNYFNDINNERTNTLFNIDYTNPISDKSKLELGAEYRADNTANTNLTNQLGFTNSSFDYDRKIYSGYVNYNHSFGKVTMQLGARLENYEIEGTFRRETLANETVTDEIFSVYPSAFFTYSPSQKNQFQMSYSRRVDRPGIQQVNPIREWSTPLITSIGNPNLVPQFTNSFEVNYTRRIKGGSLSFGTFYRKVNDVISRVTYRDPSDPSNVRQILSFANFDDTDAYGVEFSASLRVTKWWRANPSIDFYSQKQFGTADLSNPNAARIEVTNEVFNARIVNSFTASKNLNIQLFALYRGANQDIQWEVDPMWMVNLGANYRILKGQGSIILRFNDIFRGMRFQFNADRPFAQNGRFQWESRTSFLGFNYRFGGGKNRAKSRRQRDKNEKDGGGGFF